MESETDRLKRVLATNSPYYQQQDLQPHEGGRSLLHDKNGRPLHKPAPEVRAQNAPVGYVEEPERLKIRGTQPVVPQPQAPLKYRELNPTHTAQDPAPAQEPPVMDDIPVHVGNHNDHSWHDYHVTGTPVDNNDYVNAEALQGAQRLPETQQDQQVLEQQQQDAAWSDDNPPRPVISDVISQMKESDMVVLVRGDPVFVSVSEQDIKQCVEDAMLNYKVSMSDIVVVKRMVLDFGLTMK